MKTIGVFIALLVLCSFGISIGGLLWEGEVIPPWLISLFLLPAAFALDYFVKEETYPSRIRKYSTSLGILCITLTGYFLIDFLGLPLIAAFAIVFFLFFLFLMIFAPLVFILPIWPPLG